MLRIHSLGGGMTCCILATLPFDKPSGHHTKTTQQLHESKSCDRNSAMSSGSTISHSFQTLSYDASTWHIYFIHTTFVTCERCKMIIAHECVRYANTKNELSGHLNDQPFDLNPTFFSMCCNRMSSTIISSSSSSLCGEYVLRCRSRN